MKSSKEQIDKIEKTLIAAYRRQEDLQFPPDWRQQVMQDMRRWLGPLPLNEKKIRTIAPGELAPWPGWAWPSSWGG